MMCIQEKNGIYIFCRFLHTILREHSEIIAEMRILFKGILLLHLGKKTFFFSTHKRCVFHFFFTFSVRFESAFFSPQNSYAHKVNVHCAYWDICRLGTWEVPEGFAELSFNSFHKTVQIPYCPGPCPNSRNVRQGLLPRN